MEYYPLSIFQKVVQKSGLILTPEQVIKAVCDSKCTLTQESDYEQSLQFMSRLSFGEFLEALVRVALILFERTEYTYVSLHDKVLTTLKAVFKPMPVMIEQATLGE